MTDVCYLGKEQKLSITLKSLYKSYGYNEFALSSFDEYSLYSDNRNFIGGKEVISFNAGGKLLALRPDVTLSIIKNGKPERGTQKLFYDEKVYRRTAQGGIYEVSQIGVEVIGGVDLVTGCEVCTLILKTLAAISENFVLDLSHMGITVKLLDSLNLQGGDREFALSCLESKNLHDFGRFAVERGLDESRTKTFKALISLPAESKQAIEILNEINKTVDISNEITSLVSLIGFTGGDKINIDFSIGGDAEYYNGLIFKGYVDGIPHAVLSGGRYDKLLSKFGRSEGAMGFALYLGELCRYLQDQPANPDAVLVYSQEDSFGVLKKAEKLREKGLKVLLSKTVPEGFDGKIYYAENLND